jgi:hypothetical protein
MHGAVHRADADNAATVRRPGSDTVDQTSIWLSDGVSFEPTGVDNASSITASRLKLDIAGLTLATQQPADGRSTDAEHRCRGFIRRGQPVAIRGHDAPPQIQ